MYKIVLIGVGQLGSRYLKGLALSDLEIELEIVEPFDKSTVLAQNRLKELENKITEENLNENSICFY